MDLIAALKRPEGKTLEFKRDLSSPDAALRTITAFANMAGGTLLVGVEDATHHVRGVHEALDLEERLANLISDRIAPRHGCSRRRAPTFKRPAFRRKRTRGQGSHDPCHRQSAGGARQVRDCLERLVSADKVPMIRLIVNRAHARRKLPIGILDLPHDPGERLLRLRERIR